MKKRILALFLAFSLCFTSLPLGSIAALAAPTETAQSIEGTPVANGFVVNDIGPLMQAEKPKPLKPMFRMMNLMGIRSGNDQNSIRRIVLDWQYPGEVVAGITVKYKFKTEDQLPTYADPADYAAFYGQTIAEGATVAGENTLVLTIPDSIPKNALEYAEDDNMTVIEFSNLDSEIYRLTLKQNTATEEFDNAGRYFQVVIEQVPNTKVNIKWEGETAKPDNATLTFAVGGKEGTLDVPTTDGVLYYAANFQNNGVNGPIAKGDLPIVPQTGTKPEVTLTATLPENPEWFMHFYSYDLLNGGKAVFSDAPKQLSDLKDKKETDPYKTATDESKQAFDDAVQALEDAINAIKEANNKVDNSTNTSDNLKQKIQDAKDAYDNLQSKYNDVEPKTDTLTEAPAGYVTVTYKVRDADSAKGSITSGTDTYFVKKGTKGFGNEAIAAPTVTPTELYNWTGWDQALPDTIDADYTAYATFADKNNVIAGADASHPDDFVKVTFAPGVHATFATGEETVFWVKPNVGVMLSDINAPKGPVDPGFEFNGWSPEGPNGTAITREEKFTYQITQETTFTATFVEKYGKVIVADDPAVVKPNGYITVKYVLGDDNAGKGVISTPKKWYVRPGTTLAESGIATPAMDPKVGENFSKWDKELPETFGNEDVTVSAVFGTPYDNLIPIGSEGAPAEAPKGYSTVTFTVDPEKGTVPPDTVMSYYIKNGTEFPDENIPAVTAKDGWKYLGWNPVKPPTIEHDETPVAQFEQVLPSAEATEVTQKANKVTANVPAETPDGVNVYLVDENGKYIDKTTGLPTDDKTKAISGTTSGGKVEITIPDAAKENLNDKSVYVQVEEAGKIPTKSTGSVTLDTVDPVITGPEAQTMKIGDSIDLAVTATDAVNGGDPVAVENDKITVTGLPDGLTYDENTGKITGQPTTKGEYTVKITAEDAVGNKTTKEVTFSVGLADSAKPTAEQKTTSGNAKIVGEGVPGALVELKTQNGDPIFDKGMPVTNIVGTDGKYELSLPPSVRHDDVVKVTQTEGKLNINTGEFEASKNPTDSDLVTVDKEMPTVTPADKEFEGKVGEEFKPMKDGEQNPIPVTLTINDPDGTAAVSEGSTLPPGLKLSTKKVGDTVQLIIDGTPTKAGTYSFNVDIKDKVGNTYSPLFKITIKQDPSATPGNIAQDKDNITAKVPAGTTGEVILVDAETGEPIKDGENNITGTIDEDGNITVPKDKVPDGKKVKIQLTEENKSPATSDALTVDKKKPSAPTVEDLTAGDTSVKVTKPADDATTVTVKVSETETVAAEKDSDGVWKVNGTSVEGSGADEGKLVIPVTALTQGQQVSVTATDNAGNTSDPTTKTVAANKTATPSVEATNTGSADGTSGKTVVSGTAEKGATVTIKVPGQEDKTVTAGDDGSYSAEYDGTLPADTTITVTAKKGDKTESEPATAKVALDETNANAAKEATPSGLKDKTQDDIDAMPNGPEKDVAQAYKDLEDTLSKTNPKPSQNEIDAKAKDLQDKIAAANKTATPSVTATNTGSADGTSGKTVVSGTAEKGATVTIKVPGQEDKTVTAGDDGSYSAEYDGTLPADTTISVTAKKGDKTESEPATAKVALDETNANAAKEATPAGLKDKTQDDIDAMPNGPEKDVAQAYKDLEDTLKKTNPKPSQNEIDAKAKDLQDKIAAANKTATPSVEATNTGSADGTSGKTVVSGTAEKGATVTIKVPGQEDKTVTAGDDGSYSAEYDGTLPADTTITVTAKKGDKTESEPATAKVALDETNADAAKEATPAGLRDKTQEEIDAMPDGPEKDVAQAYKDLEDTLSKTNPKPNQNEIDAKAKDLQDKIAAANKTATPSVEATNTGSADGTSGKTVVSGTAEKGATVTIKVPGQEDKTVTAGDDGSYSAEYDGTLPADTTITVTAKKGDKTESEPATAKVELDETNANAAKEATPSGLKDKTQDDIDAMPNGPEKDVAQAYKDLEDTLSKTNPKPNQNEIDAKAKDLQDKIAAANKTATPSVEATNTGSADGTSGKTVVSGTAEKGATVTIKVPGQEDKTVTAGDDGSYSAEYDGTLPADTTITVTAKKGDKTESEPATAKVELDETNANAAKEATPSGLKDKTQDDIDAMPNGPEKDVAQAYKDLEDTLSKTNPKPNQNEIDAKAKDLQDKIAAANKTATPSVEATNTGSADGTSGKTVVSGTAEKGATVTIKVPGQEDKTVTAGDDGSYSAEYDGTLPADTTISVTAKKGDKTESEPATAKVELDETNANAAKEATPSGLKDKTQDDIDAMPNGPEKDVAQAYKDLEDTLSKTNPKPNQNEIDAKAKDLQDKIAAANKTATPSVEATNTGSADGTSGKTVVSGTAEKGATVTIKVPGQEDKTVTAGDDGSYSAEYDGTLPADTTISVTAKKGDKTESEPATAKVELDETNANAAKEATPAGLKDKTQDEINAMPNGPEKDVAQAYKDLEDTLKKTNPKPNQNEIDAKAKDLQDKIAALDDEPPVQDSAKPTAPVQNGSTVTSSVAVPPAPAEGTKAYLVDEDGNPMKDSNNNPIEIVSNIDGSGKISFTIPEDKKADLDGKSVKVKVEEPGKNPTLSDDGITLDTTDPVITAAETASGTKGEAINPVTITTDDPDNDNVEVTGLPTGLTYDSATKQIKGTPTVAGESIVATITVTDKAGNTATQTITFKITDPSGTPFDDSKITGIKVKTQPKLEYTEGETFDPSALVVTLTDENGTTKDVPYSDFDTYGITTAPTDSLTTADNGQPATVSMKDKDNNDISDNTEPLIVKADADNNKYPIKALDPKIEVVDPTKLTDAEKQDVKNAVKDQIPTEANVSDDNIVVDNDGKVMVTYPDGTTNVLEGKDTVVKKGDQPGVDKDALKKAIDKANDTKPKDKYKNASSDKKKAFDDALEKANKVNNDPNVTQEEVDKAKDDLDKARKALDGKTSEPSSGGSSGSSGSSKPSKDSTAKTDKGELQDATDNLDGDLNNGTEYTDDSVKRAEDAIREAEKVLADKRATQSEVDRALAKVKHAMRAMRLNVALETVDHYAFMFGYPDDTFRADRTMTRAEVAAMFSRIMLDKPVEGVTYSSDFSDVHEGDWYANVIGYMSGKGLLAGYPDGTFRPNAPITRAEFAAMASRFAKIGNVSGKSFVDTDGHWAENVIEKASAVGWVGGYDGNIFKPDGHITRAEATAIANRMMYRSADRPFVDRHEHEVARFVDLHDGYWAYNDIMEATNGHDYDYNVDELEETWQDLNGKRF